MVLRCNPCKSKQLYIRTSSSLWLSLCLLETAATSVILSFLCIGLNERSGKTSFSVQKPSECWSHRLYHPCKPSTSAICQQPGDHWKALRFHTHANYVHLCWKATALARRLSDSIRIFFFELAILTASLYWGSEGFPCRFHCVCTQLLCNMGSF